MAHTMASYECDHYSLAALLRRVNGPGLRAAAADIRMQQIIRAILRVLSLLVHSGPESQPVIIISHGTSNVVTHSGSTGASPQRSQGLPSQWSCQLLTTNFSNFGDTWPNGF